MSESQGYSTQSLDEGYSTQPLDDTESTNAEAESSQGYSANQYAPSSQRKMSESQGYSSRAWEDTESTNAEAESSQGYSANQYAQSSQRKMAESQGYSSRRAWDDESTNAEVESTQGYSANQYTQSSFAGDHDQQIAFKSSSLSDPDILTARMQRLVHTADIHPWNVKAICRERLGAIARLADSAHLDRIHAFDGLNRMVRKVGGAHSVDKSMFVHSLKKVLDEENVHCDDALLTDMYDLMTCGKVDKRELSPGEWARGLAVFFEGDEHDREHAIFAALAQGEGPPGIHRTTTPHCLSFEGFKEYLKLFVNAMTAPEASVLQECLLQHCANQLRDFINAGKRWSFAETVSQKRLEEWCSSHSMEDTLAHIIDTKIYKCWKETHQLSPQEFDSEAISKQDFDSVPRSESILFGYCKSPKILEKKMKAGFESHIQKKKKAAEKEAQRQARLLDGAVDIRQHQKAKLTKDISHLDEEFLKKIVADADATCHPSPVASPTNQEIDADASGEVDADADARVSPDASPSQDQLNSKQGHQFQAKATAIQQLVWIDVHKKGQKGNGRVNSIMFAPGEAHDEHQPLEATYDGQWKEMVKHGTGKMIIETLLGEIYFQYAGEFVDDMMQGRGTMMWPDGREYRGEFARNKFHGEGEMVFPGGMKYHGQYENGLKHGFGTLFDGQWVRYQGHWERGMRHGWGVFTDPRGYGHQGMWEEDKFVQTPQGSPEASPRFPEIPEEGVEGHQAHEDVGDVPEGHIKVTVEHVAKAHASSMSVVVPEDACCIDIFIAIHKMAGHAASVWQLQRDNCELIGHVPDATTALKCADRRSILRLSKPVGDTRLFKVGGPKLEVLSTSTAKPPKVCEAALRGAYELHLMRTRRFQELNGLTEEAMEEDHKFLDATDFTEAETKRMDKEVHDSIVKRGESKPRWRMAAA